MKEKETVLEELASATDEVAKEVIERERLVLERERVKGKDGNYYYLYRVNGKLKGRDIRSNFEPKDKGGYGVLEIIFEINDKPELIVSDEVLTDASGKKNRYKSYTVRAIDTDGEKYELAVKPARDSDKAYLDMILKNK